MPDTYIPKEMLACLKQYWGYLQFRPWQAETIISVLEQCDTLTILPTGAGKSLCFQLPALLKEGMAVVISPLISLMKDQVDGLKDAGVSAEYLNSSQPADEQKIVISRIQAGEVKILYLSPERLQTEWTIKLLRSAELSFFVIDEAHCISHWGHDFRADYRSLGMIKKVFTAIPVHAFTATATKEVQQDILKQLDLSTPKINIASVDRTNLTYRILLRQNLVQQLRETLQKHSREAGIIYCLRRDDVDNLSSELNDLGFKNLPYHAGLSDESRHSNQEAFIREEVDIIVATVAFGMGIDRPDIRFVIHAGMPKSIEHYHQETGRAGRDGLPSFCYMFYGGGDYRLWSYFLEQSPNRQVMLEKLSAMYNFCTQPQCRHKELVNYFGQSYDGSTCQACDYCLAEVEMVSNPGDIAKKILLCVNELRYGRDQGFGAGYISNVLKGNQTDQIIKWRHDQSGSFGAFSSESLAFIRYMIEQLIGQGFLRREGEYATLAVTDQGKVLLDGKTVLNLAKPLVNKKKKEIAREQKAKRARDWQGVDEGLFELLRKKRAELAREKGVPAYIIFGDRSLKDMASLKPMTKEAFAEVFGVGEAKLKSYSQVFVSLIKDYLK